MTPNREDYLKIILELGGDTTKVNNKQIVSSLAVSPASVSEMISKLVKEQLVSILLIKEFNLRRLAYKRQVV